MYSRVRPACGNSQPHEAHVCRKGYDSNTSQSWDIGCPGWTAGQAGAGAMLDALDEAMRPYAWKLHDLPDGARVECHPSVLPALHRIVIPPYTKVSELGNPLLPVPVHVMPGMERGEWRLVLTQGVISDGLG
jgi:hypothetical protein